MSLFSKFLDGSILFSFDRSGFLRHAKTFEPENFSGDGKVALITGSSSGIGFAAARLLLQSHVEVHLLSRDHQRGVEAKQKLFSEFPGSTIHLHTVDISDTQALKLWLDSDAPKLIDILVNNAGGMPSHLTFSKSGDEITWATHLLGHNVLTKDLFDKKSLKEGSRVITVSSGGMYLQKLDLTDLTWNMRPYNKYRAYANAKRAQVILNQMWAEELTGGLCFSCMHPGWVDTLGVRRAMSLFCKLLGGRLRTPEQGADTIVWLALTTNRYPSGKFWFDRRLASEHKFQYTVESEAQRKSLWKMLNSN